MNWLVINYFKEKSNNKNIDFPTQKINEQNSDEWFTSTKRDRGRVITY